jgi:hypothetical protein
MTAKVAVLLLALAACAKQTPPPAPSAVTVTYTGSEYAFAGPDTVTAGLVTVRLVNAGKEPHQLGLARLDSGKGIVDVAIAMRGRAVPGWMTFVGGTNTVLPGDTATAVQALTAGDYLLICFLLAPDGRMHLEKGMERMIVVQGAAPAATDPAADNTITLSDYDFTPAHPLTAGAHTFRVENAGPQVHQLLILRLLTGKSLADFQRWAGSEMMGQPPVRPMGGIFALTKGRHAEFTATLGAGTYVFVCLAPDENDGKTHLAHGMMRAVTVS